MEQLRHIVEDPETPAGRAFALTIQALIVYSLITFSIETVPISRPARSSFSRRRRPSSS